MPISVFRASGSPPDSITSDGRWTSTPAREARGFAPVAATRSPSFVRAGLYSAPARSPGATAGRRSSVFDCFDALAGVFDAFGFFADDAFLVAAIDGSVLSHSAHKA